MTETSAAADPRVDNTRKIRAPRGPELSAKSWLTEALGDLERRARLPRAEDPPPDGSGD